MDDQWVLPADSEPDVERQLETLERAQNALWAQLRTEDDPDRRMALLAEFSENRKTIERLTESLGYRQSAGSPLADTAYRVHLLDEPRPRSVDTPFPADDEDELPLASRRQFSFDEYGDLVGLPDGGPDAPGFVNGNATSANGNGSAGGGATVNGNGNGNGNGNAGAATANGERDAGAEAAANGDGARNGMTDPRPIVDDRSPSAGLRPPAPPPERPGRRPGRTSSGDLPTGPVPAAPSALGASFESSSQPSGPEARHGDEIGQQGPPPRPSADGASAPRPAYPDYGRRTPVGAKASGSRAPEHRTASPDPTSPIPAGGRTETTSAASRAAQFLTDADSPRRGLLLLGGLVVVLALAWFAFGRGGDGATELASGGSAADRDGEDLAGPAADLALGEIVVGLRNMGLDAVIAERRGPIDRAGRDGADRGGPRRRPRTRPDDRAR